MKVVILAGGKGTRYDTDKPKYLASIGGKPVIQHLMDIYVKQGYDELILCLGWKKEETIKYFTKSDNNCSITFVDTGLESNTAKRLKLVENYITDDNFMCNYSDGLSNVNLMKLEVRHLTNKNIATLTAMKPRNPFGELKFDAKGNVTDFKEKPKMDTYVNGGFFIFNRKIFDWIDENKNQELEKDILVKLAQENQLGAYKHDDFFITLNTRKDELEISNLYYERTKNNEELDWLRI
jgi:glucose-1-phosphate cytidylyltransferase